MRGFALSCLILLVPLAGCLGGQVPVASVFGAWNLPAGDPTPVAAEDCDALLATLNARALAEADTALAQGVIGRGGGMVFDVSVDRAVATVAMGAEQADDHSAAGAEVTGTNNQETGVDEGDILKTDGEWTYVLRGQDLYILHSDHVGDVTLHGHVGLAGHGTRLLLWTGPAGSDDPADDRLVVVSQHWEGPDDKPAPGSDAPGTTGIVADSWMPHSGWTRVAVLGLADRTAPALLHETWVSGHDVDARMVEGHAYIVVNDWTHDLGLQTWAYPEDEDLARRGLTWDTYHRLPDSAQQSIRAEAADDARNENRKKIARATLEDHLPIVLVRPGATADLSPRVIDDDVCRRFLTPEDATGRSTSTILSVALAGGVRSQTLSLVGSSPVVYGATDALVLASSSRDAWWFWSTPRVDEATDLQWFDLRGLDVTHRASGRIPGTILDSFAIDVHDGQLRVATTTGQWGRWWVDDPEPMLNHVAVFSDAAGLLVPQGIVSGIAPGERIWSARFTDDRAYLITFEQIDPLWIIDLSDPALPRVLGELEIPGVSTYIHPLSDDLLLAIGYGPGRDGLGLDWGRVQLSLFDISDPAVPTRAALLDVSPPGGDGWSEATSEHKAFTYWDALGVLAIPMSTAREIRTSQGYDYEHRNVLRIIDVDAEAKTLQVRGDVDQDGLQSDAGSWYGGIQRSYFLGYPGTPLVSVYAVSGVGVTAHALDDLRPQGAVAFDGPPGGSRQHIVAR